MVFWIVTLTLAFSSLALAHENTGWKAPVEAKKIKNPIMPEKASIEKG